MLDKPQHLPKELVARLGVFQKELCVLHRALSRCRVQAQGGKGDTAGKGGQRRGEGGLRERGEHESSGEGRDAREGKDG